MPMVSVVMPAYNAQKYIKNSIKSVLNQTFKDIELIVVNDGSSDGTEQVVSEFVEIDSRVKLINTLNQGCSHACNVGVGSSDSRWIARLDADDYAFPSRILDQFTWSEHGGYDVCGGDAVVFGKTIPRTWRYPTKHGDMELLAFFNSPVAHPASFYRRDLHQRQPYEPGAGAAEDYLFWVRHLAAGAKFTSLNKIVLGYRIHSAQISSAKRATQEKNRTSIAKIHWKNHGGEMPIDSIVRFSSIDELKTFLTVFQRIKKPVGDDQIPANELAKMIIRSDIDIAAARKVLLDSGYHPSKFLHTLLLGNSFIPRRYVR